VLFLTVVSWSGSADWLVVPNSEVKLVSSTCQRALELRVSCVLMYVLHVFFFVLLSRFMFCTQTHMHVTNPCEEFYNLVPV
jgi:hypothetical protein